MFWGDGWQGGFLLRDGWGRGVERGEKREQEAEQRSDRACLCP